jgi:hypothetical protein
VSDENKDEADEVEEVNEADEADESDEADDDDDVVIHTSTVIGNAPGASPKPRMYERSAPLPSRVRDGSFEEEHLIAGGEEVPYEAIEYFALGVIDQVVKASELKKGPLQKMVKKVTGGEESDSAKDRAAHTRQIYILDVFTSVQDQPFRFAAANVNYKSFLDKVTYVSMHNFFRFVVHFARKIPHATVTASTAAFIAKKRDKVSHYCDFHDFELEVAQQFRFNRDLIPVSEVDLSRDNYIEEWTLDDI